MSDLTDRAYARRWYTLGVLCLSLLVIVVDTTIVNVALPTFARDLHASSSGLQWIVDAYTLTFAALLLLAGAIADRYGRQRALAGGLALFAAGSLAAAFTQTTTELIAARAVMGVGGAFIMPATLSIITAVFTDHAERTKAIGLWSAVSGVGVAIGPVAGGWLLDHFSWDSIFLVNLPIVVDRPGRGALAGPGVAGARRRAARPERSGAVGRGVHRADLHAHRGARPMAGCRPGRWGSGLCRSLCWPLFVAWEARAAHPMLPLRLFRNPRFTGAGVSITVLFFALSGVVFLSSQIYQFVLGYSPLAAGVRALPSAAALVVFSPVGATLARRAGVRVPVMLGLAAVTAGLADLRPGFGFVRLRALRAGHGHRQHGHRAGHVGRDLGVDAGAAAGHGRGGFGRQRHDAQHGQRAGRGGFRQHRGVGVRQPDGFCLPGAAAAAAHRPGASPDVWHAAASAFVTGADRAVLAGAIVVAAGLVVAFRAFRPVRAAVPAASAEVPAGAAAEVPAPAEAPVLVAARG